MESGCLAHRGMGGNLNEFKLRSVKNERPGCTGCVGTPSPALPRDFSNWKLQLTTEISSSSEVGM